MGEPWKCYGNHVQGGEGGGPTTKGKGGRMGLAGFGATFIILATSGEKKKVLEVNSSIIQSQKIQVSVRQ